MVGVLPSVMLSGLAWLLERRFARGLARIFERLKRRVGFGAVVLFVGWATPAFDTPYTFVDSEMRELPVSANGRRYLLHVGLPAAYAI